MVGIGALLIPILVAAVLVFIVSSLVWMVLPHHKKDWKGLPNEDAVLAAMGDVAPGQYDFPHMESMDDMKDPDMQKRFADGPAGLFIVAQRGMPNMGKNMGIWFVYCLLVGGFVAYIAGRTLPAGTEYMRVFQITSAVAWGAYGLSHVSEAVWFHRPWPSVFKQLFDAFLYGMVTGGAFAWLWPA